jgi:hypothetical protein
MYWRASLIVVDNRTRIEKGSFTGVKHGNNGASIGLTGVWSNTLKFPRTYFLVLGGASDGPRFKAVARDSQTVTNAWYSSYWDQTVQGIDNNSSIREDLLKPLNTIEAAALLQRL